MKKNLQIIGRIIGIMVMTFCFVLVGQLLGFLLMLPLTASGNAGVAFIGEYAEFIGIWIIVIGWCLIFKKNKKYFVRFGKKAKGNRPGIILGYGLSLGIGLNLIVAFAAILHGDISLSFNSFNPLMILLFIAAVGIQSGAEELCTRWFMYNRVRDIVPDHPLIPVIVNALFFSALHAGNTGVTVLSLFNIVLVAVLYSLLIYYFDSFWACVVAHTSWNFCQSIILGLPNSGHVSTYSIWKLDAANARNSFTYDTGFGIEGTVLACIVIAIACVVVVLLGRRQNNSPKDSEEAA